MKRSQDGELVAEQLLAPGPLDRLADARPVAVGHLYELAGDADDRLEVGVREGVAPPPLDGGGGANDGGVVDVLGHVTSWVPTGYPGLYLRQISSVAAEREFLHDFYLFVNPSMPSSH